MKFPSRLPAHQRRADVRGDVFQDFHRFAGETSWVT